MRDDPPDAALLTVSASGRRLSAEELMPLMYEELRGLTTAYFARESPGHTLQPTAVVNEAYLRLIDQTRVEWQGRAHFFGVAAVLIRRILVDHARARSAEKRGRGLLRVTLSGVDVAELVTGRQRGAPEGSAEGVDFEALDAALRELAECDERQSRVVELRFFGGLSVEETAAVLGVSDRTVKTDWRFARAWLLDRLRGSTQV